jgi:hypothetical protein
LIIPSSFVVVVVVVVVTVLCDRLWRRRWRYC